MCKNPELAYVVFQRTQARRLEIQVHDDWVPRPQSDGHKQIQVKQALSTAVLQTKAGERSIRRHGLRVRRDSASFSAASNGATLLRRLEHTC